MPVLLHRKQSDTGHFQPLTLSLQIGSGDSSAGGSDGLITAYKYCQLQSLTYHVILTSITVKYCNYVLLSLAVIAQFLSLPVAGVSQVGFLSSVSDTSFQCILCIPALPHLSTVVTKTKLRKSEKLQKRQLGHKIVVLLVKHTTKHLWRK